jgi:diacylglycerol kinase (ATP)
VDALFVVNPAAGGGRGAERFERVRARAAAPGKVVRVEFTERPGQAVEIARQGAREGWRRVVAVGGDGTASEVANGLAHTDTALGIVPTGTGCDFIRTAGIPADMERAIAELWSYAPQAYDMGVIGDRRFLNAAGYGFDAAVAEEANRLKERTRAGGTWPFLVAVAHVLRRYRCPNVRIRMDDGPEEAAPALMATCANGRAYAGGMRISPRSDPRDGVLELVAVRALRPAQVVALLPSVFVGLHTRHPAVSIRSFHSLAVTADIEVPVHCDGEMLAPLTVGGRLEVRVDPAAVRVLAPADAGRRPQA